MDISHILTTVNDTLNWVATSVPWDLVIASGVLSPVLLVIKKKLDLQSEKVVSTLVLILGLVGSVATYLLTNDASNPNVIAIHALVIAAMSQPWYFTIYKPAFKWLTGELEKAAAFDAEVKSAAIPAQGLPADQAK